MRDHHDAKLMAKTLREQLARDDLEISHTRALEIVARQFGLDSWNVLSSKITPPDAIGLSAAAPILRVFDVDKAREFYLDFLGFTVDWEHRFGADFPLYFQVSRGDLRLHLSEHAGDASPGANMVVPTRGLKAFHTELTARNYRYMKPGLHEQDWGLEMQVTDPFQNRIRFLEQA